MDDINTVYALLVLIMFFVLLSRLDNRFGKIERELNEIKKRMDDYLKVQQRGVTEKVKPEGEALKKEHVKRRLKQNWKMFVLRLFRNKRNK